MSRAKLTQFLDVKESQDDLGKTEALFNLLQGNVPEGHFIKKSHIPKLTPDQAWTVIWYLANQDWKVPDHLDRCDVCGTIYDTWNGGDCLDYGKDPYNFCDSCLDGLEYTNKMRRNPDKEARKEYFAK
jgi:hypothetical protein